MKKEIPIHYTNNGTDLRQLSIFGFCGGNIQSFKKTKSLFAVLAADYKLSSDIKWDRDFFGPFSEELTTALADLQKDLLLDIYERRYNGGFSYFYELSNLGKRFFEANLGSARKILEESEVEPKEFALDCFAWNHLPCKYVFNRALKEKDMIEKLKDDDFDKATRQSWWKADVWIEEDDLEKLHGIYRKEPGITLRKLEKCSYPASKCVTYKIEIDPDLALEPYKLLSPKEEFSRNGYPTDHFPMKELDISKRELEERIERVKDCFDDQIAVYQGTFDSYMGKLKDFWMKANSCTDGAQVSFDKYGYVYVIVNADLKRKVGEEEWDLGYLNHIFHVLRPFDIFSNSNI